VPLFREDLAAGFGIDDIRDIYRTCYTGPVVKYTEKISGDGYLSANMLAGRDSMYITVEGNEDRILLLAVYDNLGKGASGAAIQCLNLATGEDQTLGLSL
jgi:N-acetyl-gamma-glutamyl-phosphate reductase